MPHVFNYEKKEFEQVHYNKVQPGGSARCIKLYQYVEYKSMQYHCSLKAFRNMGLFAGSPFCEYDFRCAVVQHIAISIEVVLIEAGVHQCCRCPSALPGHSGCNLKCEDV